MLISFRTRQFDSESTLPEDSYYGEDVARWLASQLPAWSTSVIPEDWGWAVTARKNEYRYIFGVYDHDINDLTDEGVRWIVRIFNQKDDTNWFKKLFRDTPPLAHNEVVSELVQILKEAEGIAAISTAPLE